MTCRARARVYNSKSKCEYPSVIGPLIAFPLLPVMCTHITHTHTHVAQKLTAVAINYYIVWLVPML